MAARRETPTKNAEEMVGAIMANAVATADGLE